MWRKSGDSWVEKIIGMKEIPENMNKIEVEGEYLVIPGKKIKKLRCGTLEIISPSEQRVSFLRSQIYIYI